MAISFPDLPKIQAALADVLKPTSYNGWVMLRYANDNSIVFQAKVMMNSCGCWMLNI